MGIQLKNNAVGYLATAISASDVGLVLQSGNGANFPSLGASDYFYATLESSGGTSEIVRVTARSGDSLTVVRAQESTTANSFAAGSRFELRVTAQSVFDAATYAVSLTNHRGRPSYYTNSSVSIIAAQHILMGGFRFFGSYTKSRAPVFSRAASGQFIVSLVSNLGAESTAHQNGWYAVFACANDGDAAPTFKVMPFLRAGSVSGSQITLGSAAEGVHSNIATTYSWSTSNNLAGTDCLVINETVGGRPNAFSGRVTTAAGNTSTTLTLTDIGTVNTLDWVLVAPPGFAHYCYLCAFYYESPGDVRNISDSGQLVKAKMINSADPNFVATGQVGTVSAPVAIRFGGYISPLATAVVVKETSSFSTASLGSYAAYFDTDGSQHIVQTVYGQKEGAQTETMVWDGITIPFCFEQEFYYSNAGSLVASRSGGTLEITGWIEP